MCDELQSYYDNNKYRKQIACLYIVRNCIVRERDRDRDRDKDKEEGGGHEIEINIDRTKLCRQTERETERGHLQTTVSDRDRESDVRRVKGYDGGGVAGRKGR